MSELSRREILSATVGAAVILPAGRAVAALAGETNEPLFLDASASPDLGRPIPMGTSARPDGRTLTVDSRSLVLDGKPWLPVMGEFHYSRYPAEEWLDELRKLKAGGLDMIASYVFWIHHEEVEGQWDWSGQRDLRAFVQACDEAGLMVVVRCGPWAHGEVRNGGFPDWLVKKGFRLRSDDPAYLAEAKRLYDQIAKQLQGLLWKDGGPMVGIQCENEYGGPAQHLLMLKRLAREAGLDTPLYTRTGWPKLSTAMPPGEFLPLSGAYAEGFWDRELTSMPGEYGDAFRFALDSGATTAAIGTDQLGTGKPKEGADRRYPYLCCELGGGMAVSYHRRIDVTPADVESTALVKIGSGNNLQGYYMVHGGTNPKGRLSTLQESQATGYWNDLPVKSYDFQAPLGEFGQTRPHFHGLRRLHLFLRDWGSTMARQDAHLPVDQKGLRWSVRSDGRSGALFVNNYHRGQAMPAHRDVQFQVRLASGEVTLPSRPQTIPADGKFFWPLGIDLGGIVLSWSTAQPLCDVDDDGGRVVVFAQVRGISTEFAFGPEIEVVSAKGRRASFDGQTVVREVPTGNGIALELRKGTQSVRIVLLDDATSKTVWKTRIGGRERLILSSGSLNFEPTSINLSATSVQDSRLGIYPPPERLILNGRALESSADGIFRQFQVPFSALKAEVRAEKVREAGPARKVPIGSQKVAEAPTDSDFEVAAVWRLVIKSPEPLGDLLLRVHYEGDAARLYAGQELLTDNFYNGRPFDLGFKRFGPAILDDLRLEILPLRKDAPIYLPAKPDFGHADSVARLVRLEMIERVHSTLKFE